MRIVWVAFAMLLILSIGYTGQLITDNLKLGESARYILEAEPLYSSCIASGDGGDGLKHCSPILRLTKKVNPIAPFIYPDNQLGFVFNNPSVNVDQVYYSTSAVTYAEEYQVKEFVPVQHFREETQLVFVYSNCTSEPYPCPPSRWENQTMNVSYYEDEEVLVNKTRNIAEPYDWQVWGTPIERNKFKRDVFNLHSGDVVYLKADISLPRWQATEWNATLTMRDDIVSLDPDIDACSVLAANTAYTVNDTILTTTTCFTFAGDNVTLDCQDHIIDGDDGTGDYGVYITSGQGDITIKNCYFQDFGQGLRVQSMDTGDYVNVYNTTFTSMSLDGIFFSNSAFNILIDNVTVTNSVRYGFEVDSNSGVNLNYTVTNSDFSNNAYYDLWLRGLVGGNSAARCNWTWENNTGTGGLPIGGYFNEAINVSNMDFSELVLCNADNSNFTNITLSTGGGGKNLVEITGTDYAVLDNFTVTNLRKNILLLGSSYVTIENSYITGSSYFGVQTDQEIEGVNSHITLTNNEITANGQGAIECSDTSYDTYNNNTLSDNSNIIVMQASCDYASAINNTIDSTGGYGFYLYSGSTNNNIYWNNLTTTNYWVYGANTATYSSGTIGNIWQEATWEPWGWFDWLDNDTNSYADIGFHLPVDSGVVSPFWALNGEDAHPYTNKTCTAPITAFESPTTNGTYVQDWFFVNASLNSTPLASPWIIEFNNTNHTLLDTTMPIILSLDHNTHLGETNTWMFGSGTFGFPGTVSGATWTSVNCRYGDCLSFDGNDYGTLAEEDEISFSGSFSADGWFYYTGSLDGVFRGIYGKQSSGGGLRGWEVAKMDTNHLVAWLGSGATNCMADSGATIPINTLTYVAITYDGTNLALYMNDSDTTIALMDNETTCAGDFADSNSYFTIGRWYGDINNYFFLGKIDEVKVWNGVVLSQEDLELSMNSRLYEPLKDYYLWEHNFTNLSTPATYNATLYANNTCALTNASETISSFLTNATTWPNVTLVPPTLANDSALAGLWVEVNASAEDVNGIVNTTVYLYNGSGAIGQHTENASISYYNFTLDVCGDYWINASAYNTLGNWNASETRYLHYSCGGFISIDIVPPSYDNLTWHNVSFIPINASTNISSNYTFLYLYNETSLVDAYNCTGVTWCFENYTSLPDGNYTFYAWANSSVGSTNQTLNYTVYLDTTPPDCVIVSPTDNPAVPVLGSYLTINISNLDLYPLYGNISLYLSNDTYVNGTNFTTPYSYNEYPVTTNYYFFNATCVDYAGNSHSVQSTEYTVISPYVPTGGGGGGLSFGDMLIFLIAGALIIGIYWNLRGGKK